LIATPAPRASRRFTRAAMLMAALADQTSLPWPDEFPRKRERQRNLSS